MAGKSRHVGMLDSLGGRIASGEFPPGAVISLARLEEEYSVSRTVAREAMRLLEGLGMLEARRRVGLIVTPRSSWHVLSPFLIRWRLQGPGRDEQFHAFMDLRTAIEPTAARLAAEHASRRQRERLLELAAEMRRLGLMGEGASEEYLRADVEFHRTLLDGSGNEMLAALGDVVETVLAGRTELGLAPAYPVARTLELHEATAHAVSSSDVLVAEELCRNLVTTIRSETPKPGS